MPKYSAGLSDYTTATAVNGAIAWTTAAGEWGEFVELLMTGSGVTAAADTMHRATFDFSDGGTLAIGTGQTPMLVSGQNGAASAIETEVTITTEQATIQTPPAVDFSFNQRGGMRWAVPRGEGVVLMFDHANEDASFRVISSAIGKVSSMAHWWEV